MPFRIALSGLNAASTDLAVTGANISNASTVGFKQSRAEFADLYANAVQDNGNGVGQGARVTRVAQQFSQGSVDFTSNNLDLAISGQGFFVLEGQDGTTSYTRAGAYSVDRGGNVINHAGDKLQVYEAIQGASGSTSFNTGVLSDLVLPTGPSTPQATGRIDAGLNLNAQSADINAATVPFDPIDPSTYHSSTSVSVYDSLGNAHASTLYFRKVGANEWEGFQYIDGQAVQNGTPPSDAFTLEFSDTGELLTPANGAVTMNPFDPLNGAADLDLTLDFSSSTQFGTAFGVNNLAQDGYTSGRLAGVDIDGEGVIFARYTNGQSSALGKVALAKFNNDQGLRQLGDSAWSETFDSGTAQLGEAGTSSFGQIQSGALEGSNVDISEQLVSLITAQRNFQANAEVISTGDQITQSILNIR